MQVRKVITGTITAGGLGIFLLTMLGILVVRRVKERMQKNKGKMSIAPIRNRKEANGVPDQNIMD